MASHVLTLMMTNSPETCTTDPTGGDILLISRRVSPRGEGREEEKDEEKHDEEEKVEEDEDGGGGDDGDDDDDDEEEEKEEEGEAASGRRLTTRSGRIISPRKPARKRNAPGDDRHAGEDDSAMDQVLRITRNRGSSPDRGNSPDRPSTQRSPNRIVGALRRLTRIRRS